MIALLRTEWTKAVRRARTLVFVGVLVGLPTLIAFAVHARERRPRRADGGVGMFRLAQQSGLVIPDAVLAVMAGFLLVVLAATIAGDSVAGDAGSGNLRYVLLRPVSRVKLLLAKMTIAGVLIWAITILTALTALVAGVLLFGAKAVTVPHLPSGAGATGALQLFPTTVTLSTSTLLVRLAFTTAYVAFGFTALLALGTFFSTLTDTAAGAIGATIGVYIISEVLDGIEQFGVLRYGFPTHYQNAWESLFTQDRWSPDLVAGAVVQVAYLVVFTTAAVWWFRRKDIRS